MADLEKLIAEEKGKLDGIKVEADKIDKAMQAAFSAHKLA